MSWQAALIALCVVVAAFGLGCWFGQRERPKYDWGRSYDSRNRQSAFQNIWRLR
jgi:hypothetical protein